MARFSLRQLLAFGFACCFYLAVVRVFIVSIVPNADAATKVAVTPLLVALTSWHSIVTQIGAWLVLSLLYYCWRLWLAMLIHVAGFVVFLVLMARVSLTFDEVAGLASAMAVFGCMLGALVSFPLAITTIAFRSLRAGRRGIGFRP